MPDDRGQLLRNIVETKVPADHLACVAVQQTIERCPGTSGRALLPDGDADPSGTPAYVPELLDGILFHRSLLSD
jgi:hypothetical protein